MSTILQILRNDTRAWWYHKQLRDYGHIEKARKRENQSIRSNVSQFREAIVTEGAYLSIGRGGHTLHLHNCTISGYEDANGPTAQICRKLNIPIINTTTIPDKIVILATKLPLVAVGDKPENPPYGSLSYAPLPVVAGMYAQLGATIENLDFVANAMSQLTIKPQHDKLIQAFASGNELELAKLLLENK